MSAVVRCHSITVHAVKAKLRCVLTLSRDCACCKQYYCLHSTMLCVWQLLVHRCNSAVANEHSHSYKHVTLGCFEAYHKCGHGVYYTISSLYLSRAVLLLAQHYTVHLTTVDTARMCRSRKRTQFIATDMSHFAALKLSTNTVCSYTSSRLCLCQAVLLLAQQ
jgi:hypothetical protein